MKKYILICVALSICGCVSKKAYLQKVDEISTLQRLNEKTHEKLGNTEYEVKILRNELEKRDKAERDRMKLIRSVEEGIKSGRKTK